MHQECINHGAPSSRTAASVWKPSSDKSVSTAVGSIYTALRCAVPQNGSLGTGKKLSDGGAKALSESNSIKGLGA